MCGQVDLKRYAPQNEKIEGGRTIFLGDMALGVSEDDVKALFEPTSTGKLISSRAYLFPSKLEL